MRIALTRDVSASCSSPIVQRIITWRLKLSKDQVGSILMLVMPSIMIALHMYYWCWNVETTNVPICFLWHVTQLFGDHRTEFEKFANLTQRYHQQNLEHPSDRQNMGECYNRAAHPRRRGFLTESSYFYRYFSFIPPQTLSNGCPTCPLSQEEKVRTRSTSSFHQARP